jgi:hypothetical protein
MDEVDIGHLIAYLPDEIREYGREIVEVIKGIGDFKTSIEDNKRIVFKVEGIPIAEIEYGEENFWVKYKNRDGDMIYTGPAIYSREIYESHKEGIKHLVSGAYRRWGSNLQLNKVFVELEDRFPEMRDFFKITRKITTHFWMYGERELPPECIAALRAASEVIAEKCRILSSSQTIGVV